ncbi:hypothetical protein ZIOFF_049211 [Zingiber officinale]|uniref:Subtilisin-like protease SBT1.5 n=1 Tax=Zingiber officinale TaxID=94328 RepID=A0A8J5KT42_ZINOF|nr:hypothetical protein ZIOFF_049211 [Zingiber officinale]
MFIDFSSYYGFEVEGFENIEDSEFLYWFCFDKAQVALVPGAVGDNKCIQISYAASLSTLQEAMKIKEDMALLKSPVANSRGRGSSSRLIKMEIDLYLRSLFFLFLFFLPSISAVELLNTYIVRVDADAKPSIFPTHAHWYETSLLAATASADGITDFPPGGFLIHTYSSLFHGFSTRISPSTAASLASTPGFLAVVPELVRHPDTTRSPEFLGLLSSDRTGLLAESDFGSELVIAVVDTGITPGHRSFADSDLGLAPSRWRGQCVSGPGFPASSCNRKLIGARYFSAGYEATSGRMNESVELRSPRDTDGHGTHTASIAAGRYVFPASTLGYARGVAAGMAPKARLAAYKVCWVAGCFDSDILAAFDSAVADGVDVVSLSVGGVVVPYYLDAIAVGAFAAAEAGIFVSASAGNGGPGGLTVTNVAPWVATVGAGSMDRDFPADVKLGNGRVLPGVSVYGGPSLDSGRLYPLVYAGVAQGAGDGYSSSLCLEGSLNSEAVKGKIVLCDRGVNSRTAKGEVVRKAGAVGMILANGVFDGEGLVADCHVLPATAVGAVVGDVIRKYIATSTSRFPATATILFRGTRLGVHPAPVIASFSARGPNPQSPEILKPDLVAPGLHILAAWPHNQNIKAITRKAADCRGARKAGHAGNLNYPSFSAVFAEDGSKRRMATHFIRTVTNVGNGATTYRATVQQPEGSTVTVEPMELSFRRSGQKLSFLVRVKAETWAKMAPGNSRVRSGSLTWSDGRHSVRSPIAVTVQAPFS